MDHDPHLEEEAQQGVGYALTCGPDEAGARSGGLPDRYELSELARLAGCDQDWQLPGQLEMISATDWEPAFECCACSRRLSRRQRFYSGGICPQCEAKSGSTVVDCRTIAVRWVTETYRPWWKFWAGPWRMSYEEVHGGDNAE